MSRTIILIFFNLFVISSNCLAIKDPAKELQPAGIFTELGTQLDLSIEIQDSSGSMSSLGSLLSDHRPLIIVPSYYRCPRLCGLVLGGVAQLVKDLDLKLGTDYRIATYSFNPVETLEEAASKKEHYAKILSEEGKSIDGWNFFLADQKASGNLNKLLGFGVVPDGQDFAHSAAIFIISPDGRISQYFSNIDFSAGDARLALIEASQGKIGNLMDQVMLFCFEFNATKGQYTWAVFRLLNVVGVLCIIIVGGIIVYYLMKDKNKGAQS